MMLHPATVHFAMVLPLVASTFGVIYLFTKTEGMSKISSRLTLVSALAMIGVWYTGNQAGPQIFQYLSEAGKHELLEHKALGLYLAIAISFIAILKIAGCKTHKFILEAVAVVLLVGVTATTFLQGKHGGEIVYEYGMPFKVHSIETNLHKAVKNADEADEDGDKVEIYEDAIDDIDSISQEINKVYGLQEETEEDSD